MFKVRSCKENIQVLVDLIGVNKGRPVTLKYKFNIANMATLVVAAVSSEPVAAAAPAVPVRTDMSTHNSCQPPIPKRDNWRYW